MLTPPDLSRPRRLQRRLEGHQVEWHEATGQDRLLDSRLQEPPLDTIGRTADWLAAALGGEPVTAVVGPVAPTTVVGRTGSGRPVVERTVRLGSLGLFGILTEPADGATGPVIVLVDEGNTHHIGQARIWVDLARRLAPAGLRVLRFDLSGNGDSGARPGQPTHVARAPEAIDDVYEAMRGVSPGDPSEVVLVGFCSGAYQVLEQALVHPPTGICVINPSFSFRPPEPTGTSARPARQITRPWFVRLVEAPLRRLVRDRSSVGLGRWMNALEVGTWPVALAKRHPGIPSAVWWTVNRTLLENPAIGTLERVVDQGVDTLLVCGPGDLLPVSLGSEGRIRRLKTSRDFHLELLDELDHASWVKRQRERLIEVVDAYLVARYAGCRHRHRSEHRAGPPGGHLPGALGRPTPPTLPRRGRRGPVEDGQKGRRLGGPGRRVAVDRARPGRHRGPVQDRQNGLGERLPVGHHDGWVQTPEAGHRGGHSRSAHGQELACLQRVETLDERGGLVGDHLDIGVLEVARHLGVGAAAEDDRPRLHQYILDFPGQAVRPDEHQGGPSDQRPGQCGAQLDVEPAGAQGALVEHDPPDRQVAGALGGSPEGVEVDPVGDEVDRTVAATALGQGR